MNNGLIFVHLPKGDTLSMKLSEIEAKSPVSLAAYDLKSKLRLDLSAVNPDS